ncbi:MAG TPA: glycosyltransferase family 4 protein [Tepidisphaeraceae bacterium]|nr:glycosyltransferase family 4 protein [Tepidisphaeraceae bacterium]
MAKPTIVYIAGTFPLRSETFVYREVRELRRRGWTVIVCGLHPSPDANDPTFKDLSDGALTVYDGGWAGRSFGEFFAHPVSSLSTLFTAIGDAISPGETMKWRDRLKLPAQAFASLGLAKKLRDRKIERIHCHFAHAATTIGMYAARALGIPFSFTGHANDLFQRRALLAKKLQRSSFVSCISEWHRDWYHAMVPDRAKKYRVVRCGVDVNAWGPLVSNGTDALRVLTVCRLVEKKGTDTLIRALSEYGRQTGKAWHLVVAGDGPEQKNLVRLANDLACSESVEFLGAVDNARVQKLLSEAQVFALPCRRDANGDADGIPVVLMEAMACGVPVISGDLPAIRELVEHNKNGILVDGRDVPALTAALKSITSDESRRKELGTAGRNRVVEEFSLAKNVDRLETLLAGSSGAEIHVAGVAQPGTT